MTSRSAFMKRIPACKPPCSSKAIMPPNWRIWRWASACWAKLAGRVVHHRGGGVFFDEFGHGLGAAAVAIHAQGQVLRPRMTKAASCADITAPVMSFQAVQAHLLGQPASANTAQPAVRSPWPLRYLVMECTNTSAPSNRAAAGACSRCVHHHRAPPWGHGADGGDVHQAHVGAGRRPKYTTLVCGPMASATACGLVMSTWRTHAKAGHAVGQEGKRAAVQGQGQPDFITGCNSDQSVAVMAPMPEPNTTAPAPCSRLVRRDSSKARRGVGNAA